MKMTWLLVAMLSVASASTLAAPSSCENVKNDIQQKIINNGVPENDFSLTIVPNDRVDEAGAQVVGHCANDTHKILYTRSADAAANNNIDAGSQ